LWCGGVGLLQACILRLCLRIFLYPYFETLRHNGRWGTATLEVVLAIMQSAREHREIRLPHQCDAY